MWIKNFINELKAWKIVRKVYKENRKEFEKLHIHMDWGGKLYTVINRDTDVVLGSDEDKVYLHNDLAKIWSLFTKLNIADIVAYDLKPLEDERKIDDEHIEYEHGYLLIFTPAWKLDRQYVNWKSLLFVFLFLCGIVAGAAYIVLKYV